MQKHRFYFISPPSMAVLKRLSRENRTCSAFYFRTMLETKVGS